MHTFWNSWSVCVRGMQNVDNKTIFEVINFKKLYYCFTGKSDMHLVDFDYYLIFSGEQFCSLFRSIFVARCFFFYYFILLLHLPILFGFQTWKFYILTGKQIYGCVYVMYMVVLIHNELLIGDIKKNITRFISCLF